jgi:hypothetical protein
VAVIGKGRRSLADILLRRHASDVDRSAKRRTVQHLKRQRNCWSFVCVRLRNTPTSDEGNAARMRAKFNADCGRLVKARAQNGRRTAFMRL